MPRFNGQQVQSGKALIDHIAETSQRRNLFLPGVSVVGVSGGTDSLALLHILIHLRDRLSLNLHVATLDHGLRGEAGRADAEFVRETAEAWGVPVTVGSADVPALQQTMRGSGIEGTARYARYHFFADVVKATGAVQLALAHQRDDQVETILMHLIRGAGLTGLIGMRPMSIRDGLRIVRPLLDIPRVQLDYYVQEQGLHPREDGTNADRRYTRNAIRLETVPYLRQQTPSFEYHLLKTAEILRAEEDALAWALQQALPDWPARAELSAFKQLPLGLQRIAIRQLVSTLSFDATLNMVEWLGNTLPGEQYYLGEGRGLSIDRNGVITIIPGRASDFRFDPAALPFPILETDQPIPLAVPANYGMPGGWRLIMTPYAAQGSESAQPMFDDPLAGVIHIPANASIALRTRRSGDRFAALGLGGHLQKLSDTMINLKVPSRWRDSIPLLTIDDQLAWFVVPTPDGLRALVADPFAWRAGRTPLWEVRYNRPS